MTLSSEVVRTQYAGDDSTVAFPTGFVFWDADDLLVVHADSTGAETTWVRGTQYTVSGGDGSTGTVTVATSPTDYTPATGETLTIKSNLTNTQGTSFPEGGPFPSASAEQQFDKNVRLTQQQEETLGRQVTFPISDPDTLSAELPIATDRASKFIAFDASGNVIASTGPTGDSSIPVSSYIETLLDDTTSAVARATLELGGWSTKSPVVLAKTAAYTILAADDGKLIDGDATSGAFTVTLPAAATAGDGFEITIKKTDSGSNAVTVDGNGAETIDGETTLVLSVQHDSATLRCDGTEWHVVSKSQAGAVLAKAAAYTVVAADDGSLITVDASAAARTITLPAAPATSMTISILALDATNPVTVAGNGKNIGGLANVNLQVQYDYVDLVYSGTEWLIVSQLRRYVSAGQTITSSGGLTLAHGLGVDPEHIQYRLVCGTADANYSIGDEIVMNNMGNDVNGTVNRGMVMFPDATNIGCRFGTATAAFTVLDKTGGANTTITNASWTVEVRAWA